MREPRWVPRLVIESVHFDQVREHGGVAGLRDENALESALARARHKWALDPATDLAALGAAYAFGLSSSHPFVDGNKRIAFLAMVIFLGLNKKDLSATEVEVVQAMMALATGSMKEAALASWVRERMSKRKD